MPRRSIILTGMMASGKSAVGRALAQRLDWPFVDLDSVITARSGRTIPQWFELSEAMFRQTEHDVLIDLLAEEGEWVLALGGGALEQQASRLACLARGFVVYLDAPVELLARRAMTDAAQRPLLQNAEDPQAKLATLLSVREVNYRCAHLFLPVADLTPDELARAIEEAYRYGADQPAD